MISVQILLVLILFLALLISIFTVQNPDPIRLRLFFWHPWISPAIIIMGSAFLGGLAVLLAGLFRRKKAENIAKSAVPPAVETEVPADNQPTAVPESGTAHE